MTPTNQARDEAARIDMESVQRARAWVRSMYEGNPITPIQPDYAFLAGWDSRDKVAKDEAKQEHDRDKFAIDYTLSILLTPTSVFGNMSPFDMVCTIMKRDGVEKPDSSYVLGTLRRIGYDIKDVVVNWSKWNHTEELALAKEREAKLWAMIGTMAKQIECERGGCWQDEDVDAAAILSTLAALRAEMGEK
jgi:hypothetical protein